MKTAAVVIACFVLGPVAFAAMLWWTGFVLTLAGFGL